MKCSDFNGLACFLPIFSALLKSVSDMLVNTVSESCVHLFRCLADDILADVGIDVHGRRELRMSKERLGRLWLDSVFKQGSGINQIAGRILRIAQTLPAIFISMVRLRKTPSN